MKKFLVTSHRWVGFPVGILFVVLFGTGFITAIDELLIRFNDEQTSHSFTYRQTSIEEDANFLTRFTENKQNLSRAFMPTRSSPYYQLASRNERWLYSIDTPNTEFHQIKQDNEFFKTVLQLHRNFLLGKEGFAGIEGKHYAAWVGLIALILSLIGLWIWWPRRKLFNIKDTLPRGKKRKQLYGNHTSAGVISAIAILIVVRFVF